MEPRACQAKDPSLQTCGSTQLRSALAWGVVPEDKRNGVPEIIVKDGGIGGFSSEVRLMPARDIAVVVFANARETNVEYGNPTQTAERVADNLPARCSTNSNLKSVGWRRLKTRLIPLRGIASARTHLDRLITRSRRPAPETREKASPRAAVAVHHAAKCPAWSTPRHRFAIASRDPLSGSCHRFQLFLTFHKAYVISRWPARSDETFTIRPRDLPRIVPLSLGHL